MLSFVFPLLLYNNAIDLNNANHFNPFTHLQILTEKGV